jgi:hypothetical protein
MTTNLSSTIGLPFDVWVYCNINKIIRNIMFIYLGCCALLSFAYINIVLYDYILFIGLLLLGSRSVVGIGLVKSILILLYRSFLEEWRT